MAEPAVEGGWRDLFERLCERFPTLTPVRVEQALKTHNGHAGNAASELRDLTSIKVKPPDPDDVEHVATLLSSPMMFKHACKENFAKFDFNGDGVLQFPEIVALTNELYYSFGLTQPSEACLKAFFDVTDENNDGVLSEREFRRFFEMFLRYAFFDVLKLQQLLESQAVKATQPRTSPKAQSQHISPKKGASASPPMHQERREQRQPRQSRRPEDDRDRGAGVAGRRSCAFGGAAFVCVAPEGIAFRRKPDFEEKEDLSAGILPQNTAVQALEHWIRTPHGWLPVSDATGVTLLEPKREHRPKAENRVVPTGLASASEQRRREAALAAEHAARRAPEPERRREAAPQEAEAPRRQREREAEENARREASREAEARRRKAEAEAATLAAEQQEADRAAAVVDAVPSPQRSRRPFKEPAPAAAQDVQAVEVPEEYRTAVETLSKRFPQASVARIVKALRDNAGHAGKAAKELR